MSFSPHNGDINMLQSPICSINGLPSELLAHIFVLGMEEDPEDEDEEGSDTFSVSDSGEESGGAPDEGSTDSSEDDESDEDSDSDEGDGEGGHGSASGSEAASVTPFELLVSAVCQKWREIAIGTPMLWTDVEFIVEGSGPRRTSEFEKQKEYLRRSKASPVSICLDLVDDEDRNYSGDESEEEDGIGSPRIVLLRTILGIIGPHVSHWQAFDLKVSYYEHMQCVLEALGKYPSAPMLEVLELYDHGEDTHRERFTPAEWKTQDFILFNGNVPRLAHVVLWGVHLDWKNSRFLTDLHELELAYHADDVSPSFRDFARILRESPRLQALTLLQSGPAGDRTDWVESAKSSSEAAAAQDAGETTANSFSPFSPSTYPLLTITLPELKKLEIGYCPPEYIIDLYKLLDLPPTVHHLSLDFDDDDYAPFLKQLLAPHPVSEHLILSGVEEVKMLGFVCTDSTLVRKAYAQMDKVKLLKINMDYLDRSWYALLLENRSPSPVDSESSTKLLSTSGSGGLPAHANNINGGGSGGSGNSGGGRGGSDGVNGPQETESPARVYLPHLEELHTSALKGGELRDLVRFRQAMKYPLKKLVVASDDDVSEEHEAWLMKHLQSFEYAEDSDTESMGILELEGDSDAHDSEEDEWEDVDDDDDDDDDEDDDDEDEDEDEEDE